MEELRRFIACRMAKAGINVVTRFLAAESQGMGILVNSVDLGWVRTDMGGRGAIPDRIALANFRE